MVNRLMKNYSMILVLFGLCILFSILTLKEQSPDSSSAADQIIEKIEHSYNQDDIIITVDAFNKHSESFAILLKEKLEVKNHPNVLLVTGIPRDLRLALDSLKLSGKKPSVIATRGDVEKWRVIELLPELYPEFSDCEIIVPETYLWPDFLKQSNLVAIADRIVVIAVMASGMTMVIITGGIDLSVGSLIAVSAVISTIIMKMMGGLEASAWAVFVGFLAGIFAGLKVPPLLQHLELC
jgi:ribose transport system permease protein